MRYWKRRYLIFNLFVGGVDYECSYIVSKIDFFNDKRSDEEFIQYYADKLVVGKQNIMLNIYNKSLIATYS